MARGELVPDATVLDVLRERAPCLSCHGGFILDGFPRTLAQAEALDALLTEQGVYLDGVVNLTMPLEKIVDRLSGRRTCTGCKAVYHVTARPPKVAARCDVCGGALFHREDDFPEAIRTRMATYEAQTAPLAAYYQSRQLLVPIDAQGAPEIICQATVQALRARRAVAA
jgi:adenylate kinase